MMARTFMISDLHIGHKNILNWGRQEFLSIEDMHEEMIKQWNSVVTKRDLTYVLGDVCFDKQYLPLLTKMNGNKKLILGNHDRTGDGEMLKYFQSVHGAYPYKGCVLTHIPIHPSEFCRWRYNIHGHLHDKRIQDVRYINVNVDMLPDYRPVPFDTLIKEQDLRCAY